MRRLPVMQYLNSDGGKLFTVCYSLWSRQIGCWTCRWTLWERFSVREEKMSRDFRRWLGAELLCLAVALWKTKIRLEDTHCQTVLCVCIILLIININTLVCRVPFATYGTVWFGFDWSWVTSIRHCQNTIHIILLLSFACVRSVIMVLCLNWAKLLVF